MKYKVLRKLMSFRKYANTERGEKIIVRTLTSMSVILVVDIALLIVGSINQ